MKFSMKNFFTLSLSVFTIFTSSFDTFAMEQKPETLPITYYFGCGKDIYDGFSQAKSCRSEQDKLEKNFDAK